MKISLEWLKEYVELPSDLTVAKLMHDLTMATVEVEGAEELGSGLLNVVVALIEKVEPFPGRENLRLVTCRSGKSELRRVACGAENVVSGMKVALALPGARIRPYGEAETKTVEAVDISGTKSEAVICAASELSLEGLFPTESKRAVMDLAELRAEPGTPLADVIGWNDTVLEIDNKSLTNRPDLWGHYGIARELAAIYQTPLRPLCLPQPRPSQPPSSARKLTGQIDDAHCRRFTALHIRNVEHRPAPLWMRSRLARIGQRAINFFADITNYVMFATGQPTHAYDAARLELPLGARPGKDGESLVLLDGTQYSLSPSVLAITDGSGVIAAAGVMGGDSTGITDATREVVLEAANFDPIFVRRGAKRLGVRTEASSRFEKGIDTQRIDGTLDLFIGIVKAELPGVELVSFEDVKIRETESHPITVSLSFLNARLGKKVETAEIVSRLQSVGFGVELSGEVLTVLPPSWRSTGDVSQRFDLVEEVARLHGYDDFHFVPASVELGGRAKNDRAALERRIREILAFSCGMQEVVTYPWVKDRFLEAAGYEPAKMLKLAAGPAPDQSCLQPSLVPNLLESVVLNLRYFPAFRIFEAGMVMLPNGEYPAKTDPREKLPYQRKHIAGVLVGDDPESLFREAKGILERIRTAAHVASLGYSAQTDAPWADSSGRLGIVANGKPAGALGIITNRAKRLAGIRRGNVVVFELDIDALEPLPSRENRYRPVPEFPGVELDISLLFANERSWAEIAKTASASHPLVDDVIFVDQYRGADIPAGKKSITLRVRILSRERTLKSEEAQEVGSCVSGRLIEVCGAGVRG